MTKQNIAMTSKSKSKSKTNKTQTETFLTPPLHLMGDDTVKLRDTIRHLLLRQSCSFSDEINDLQQLETYLYVYYSDTLTAVGTQIQMLI